jgi:hypothetical protein
MLMLSHKRVEHRLSLLHIVAAFSIMIAASSNEGILAGACPGKESASPEYQPTRDQFSYPLGRSGYSLENRRITTGFPVIWLDEESPLDIYIECLYRTATTSLSPSALFSCLAPPGRGGFAGNCLGQRREGGVEDSAGYVGCGQVFL